MSKKKNLEDLPTVTCRCGATFLQTRVDRKSCSANCAARFLSMDKYYAAKEKPRRQCLDCVKMVEIRNKGVRCYACHNDFYKAKISPEEYKLRYGLKNKDKEARKSSLLTKEQCYDWIDRVMKRDGHVDLKELIVDLPHVVESIGGNSLDYLEGGVYYMYLWQYCLAWMKTGRTDSKRDKVAIKPIKKLLGIQ